MSNVFTRAFALAPTAPISQETHRTMNHRFPRRAIAALVLALQLPLGVFASEAPAAAVDAAAAPAPVPFAAGVHSFHSQEKFQLFGGPPGARLPNGVLNWVYNDTNRPAGITKAAVLAQINASMAKWSAVCKVTFNYQGENPSAPFSLTPPPPATYTPDGVNVIGWDKTGISAPTTGITTVAWDGSNHIIDAEVRFNAAYSTTYSPAVNFDTTATHEIGHALGLQHSDVAGQVMSGPPSTTYTGLTTLQSDDIAGCVSLYGSPGSAPPTCTGTKPPNDVQTLACPAGQTGSIIQQRSYSCAGTTWTPGAFGTTSNTCASAPSATPASEQGAWWGGSAENGWGFSFVQHGAVLTAGWYIYDASGNPVWLIMPGGQWDVQGRTFSGAVYSPSGSWFGNYNTANFNLGNAVGIVSLTCRAPGSGTLNYTVNGVSGTKQISRLAFGAAGAPVTQYDDVWWGGQAQDGWGIAIQQSGDTLAAVWYTYDLNGKPVWYIMNGGSWSAPGVWSGPLTQARGAPVIGTAYDAKRFAPVQVGTMTINFSDPSHANATAVVNGFTQALPIARLAF